MANTDIHATGQKVSIVLPIYNQGTMLSETFESLFAQTYRNLEIIAVDDGSKDNSVQVLKSFQDKRLIIKCQKNAGQAAAINRGLEMVSGAFVKIMDGDDVLNTSHIEDQMRALAGHPKKVASSRWTYFVEDPNTATFVDEITDRDYNNSVDWIIDTLKDSRGMFGAWQWLIPKSLVDSAGIWNESLSLEADFEFTIRLLLASEGIRFAQDAKLFYRKGVTSSMSRTKNLAFMESALVATESSVVRLVERSNSDYMRKLCADRFQRLAFGAYPKYPELANRAEGLAKQYGGSDVRLPGGIISKLLLTFLPWRAIRQLQEFVYSYGWQYVLRFKELRRNAQLQY